jgi:diaminopimelate epimerase
VNFVQADDAHPDRITVRTYERGVEAETLACGTGVTAAAVLHAVRQGVPSSNGASHARRIAVQVRSGDTLYVSMRLRKSAGGVQVSDVVLEGPARRVFDGTALWPQKES